MRSIRARRLLRVRLRSSTGLEGEDDLPNLNLFALIDQYLFDDSGQR